MQLVDGTIAIRPVVAISALVEPISEWYGTWEEE